MSEQASVLSSVDGVRGGRSSMVATVDATRVAHAVVAGPREGLVDPLTIADINVRDEGFTVLSEGVNPVADIVFIHGVQGHPKKTWNYVSDPPNPERKTPKLFRRKKPHRDVHDRITAESLYWPVDLLSGDFKNTRILTYGYDSHVSHFFKGPTNQNNIAAHGRSLLNALELQRREDIHRPIIFIAHSLGGIILKEALRRSRHVTSEEDWDLKNVYQSTYAIIFFGTPHGGSAYAQLGLLARDVANAAGFATNDKILRNLKPDGETLERLREEFGQMLGEHAFKVYSFQEGQGFTGYRGLSRKIVDDISSSLNDARERKDFINANHMMMCRFYGPSDEGYRKVKGVLSKYVDEIQTKKVLQSQRLDRERKRLLSECLHNLRTAGMNERMEEITIAHPHTFDWIYTAENSGFDDWLRGSEGMFWIKGRPGSGKSTLMKYIVNDERTRDALLSSPCSPLLAIASFFFHDRGTQTAQKTFDGLLRSILHQILSDLPDLFTFVEETYRKAVSPSGVCEWTTVQLEKALTDVINQREVKGFVFLFVDALDEYSGAHRDIARFLKRLVTSIPGQTFNIRICASSRPLNVFEAMLGELPGLAIHDWTAADIALFISDRLTECKRVGIEPVQEEISKRAEGVFLWVKLVIDQLSQALFDGEPVDTLLSMLSELPADLPDFYRRMLNKIPEQKRSGAMSMIQLALCSIDWRFPITLAEFSLAIDLPDVDLSPEDYAKVKVQDDIQRCSEMERRIRSYCGGLLEVIHPEPAKEGGGDKIRGDNPKLTESKVQFLHQTAKEFVQDQENSHYFQGKSPDEHLVAGHVRLMRLYTYLAYAKKPMLVSTSIKNGCVPMIGYQGLIFVADILALRPYLQSEFGDIGFESDSEIEIEAGSKIEIEAGNEIDNVAYEADTAPEQLTDRFYTHARAVECLSKQAPSRLVSQFDRILRTSKGSNWIEGRWKVFGGSSKPWHTKPPSYLFTCVWQGLFLVAKDLIETQYGEHVDDEYPLLLQWTISSYSANWRVYLPGGDTSNSKMNRLQDFVKFLLSKVENPTTAFTLSFTQRHTITDSRSVSSIGSDPLKLQKVEHVKQSAEAGELREVYFKITPLNYSLIRKSRSAEYLDLIRILVEDGACTHEDLNQKCVFPPFIDVVGGLTIPVYMREVTASVLHRILYDLVQNNFDSPETGPALSGLITSLLARGANPDATDGAGKSVLEMALPICPYELIELMLQKGARITPKLLLADGSPCLDGNGILNEPRWRRPECYTPEAVEIARQNNSEWTDLERKPAATDNAGGIFEKMRGYIGWR